MEALLKSHPKLFYKATPLSKNNEMKQGRKSEQEELENMEDEEKGKR